MGGVAGCPPLEHATPPTPHARPRTPPPCACKPCPVWPLWQTHGTHGNFKKSFSGCGNVGWAVPEWGSCNRESPKIFFSKKGESPVHSPETHAAQGLRTHDPPVQPRACPCIAHNCNPTGGNFKSPLMRLLQFQSHRRFVVHPISPPRRCMHRTRRAPDREVAEKTHACGKAHHFSFAPC